MVAQYPERWNNIGSSGDRTASITVTTDATLGGGTINNFVDGAVNNNTTDSWWFNSGQSGRSITFDFGSGAQKRIRGFCWRKNTTNSHGDWKFQGSNDGSTWLDITNAITLNKEYNIGISNGLNDGYYRYFRLLQDSGTTSQTPWNQEIYFLIYDGAGADDRGASTPSYSHVQGTGNRRPYIDASGTITWAGAGDPDLILNGSMSGEVWFNGGQTSRYIEFDFFQDVVVNEFKFYQNSATSQGTWKWQGYDEDSATWVDIGSSFTLGTGTTTTVTAISGATTYHSKFRLTQVSGSTNSGPFVYEIEFSVGDPEIGLPVTVAARQSQLALLAVVDPGAKPTRTTLIAALAITLPFQPTKISQLPAHAAFTVKAPNPPTPIIPVYPITETWQYKTVLRKSLVNKEQRASLRQEPKILHQFILPIIEEEDRRELYHLLFRYQGMRFNYPAFQYNTRTTSTSLEGSSTLYFDPEAANVRDSAWVAIFSERWTFLGYVELDVVTPSPASATTASPLEFEVPEGSVIMLAPEYRLPDKQTLTMGYPHGGATLTLEIMDPIPLINQYSDAVSLDTYAGMTLLKKPFDMDDVAENFNKGVQTIDNGLTQPHDYSQYRGPMVTQNRTYVVDKDELPYWRALADNLRGSQKKFLLPSHRNDLRLLEQPALGSKILITDDQGYREYMRRAAYQFLQIETVNGTIYRKVASVTPVLATGDAMITLDTALGSNPGDNELEKISITFQCRIANDGIEIKYHPNHIEVRLAAQTVNE